MPTRDKTPNKSHALRAILTPEVLMKRPLWRALRSFVRPRL